MAHLDIKRIDQLHAEGRQAAADRLPFSACPYPYFTEHARVWEGGWMSHSLNTKGVAA